MSAHRWTCLVARLWDDTADRVPLVVMSDQRLSTAEFEVLITEREAGCDWSIGRSTAHTEP